MPKKKGTRKKGPAGAPARSAADAPANETRPQRRAREQQEAKELKAAARRQTRSGGRDPVRQLAYNRPKVDLELASR